MAFTGSARQDEPKVDLDASVEAAWRRYGPAALRFATALVGPSDAHDITANAFLRVTRQSGWTNIEQLDRYLLRAVRNEASNLARARRRRWERDLQAVADASSIDALVDIDVLRAIAKLSIQQRSVIFLAYWQQMTETEIASTLAISRGTVHRTLSRAQHHLREALK
jgi:RNA polymerase sigma-70 factor (ECF subfamily)